MASLVAAHEGRSGRRILLSVDRPPADSQVSGDRTSGPRKAGKLLAIRTPDGRYRYPVAQFDEVGVVPGLELALGAFVIDDPWMHLAALVNASPALEGRSVLQAFRDARTEREKAVAVIRSYFGD